MVTQIKDAAITITIVKEAAELEEARDDYPERVEGGDELSEIAEYNRGPSSCSCGPMADGPAFKVVVLGRRRIVR